MRGQEPFLVDCRSVENLFVIDVVNLWFDRIAFFKSLKCDKAFALISKQFDLIKMSNLRSVETTRAWDFH
jgi:hypothetical protein